MTWEVVYQNLDRDDFLSCIFNTRNQFLFQPELSRSVFERTREALGFEVDISLHVERLIRTLNQIIGWRGAPKANAQTWPWDALPRISGWPSPLNATPDGR